MPREHPFRVSDPPQTPAALPHTTKSNPPSPARSPKRSKASRAIPAPACANIFRSDPAYSARRNLTNAFNFRPFCRKYPAGRKSVARCRTFTRSIPATLNKCSRRRFAKANSTFFHEVFCVRIVPTITSKGVSPGHQCCGPSAVKSELKYSSKGGCDSGCVRPAPRMLTKPADVRTPPRAKGSRCDAKPAISGCLGTENPPYRANYSKSSQLLHNNHTTVAVQSCPRRTRSHTEVHNFEARNVAPVWQSQTVNVKSVAARHDETRPEFSGSAAACRRL